MRPSTSFCVRPISPTISPAQMAAPISADQMIQLDDLDAPIERATLAPWQRRELIRWDGSDGLVFRSESVRRALVDRATPTELRLNIRPRA